MKGVAFKVTYNDGGANGGLVGYRGICSNPNIVQNVLVKPVTWCSQEDNACREFCDAGLTGRRPAMLSPTHGHCYEAGLLLRRPLRFGAGFYHNGPREGEPMPISQVEVGDVVFLTTIAPGGEQDDRLIFGCYRVGRLYFENNWGNIVESDGTMEIVLPDDVARGLLYWNYQEANRDGTRWWGSGLHRYLDEVQTKVLLEDLLWRLGDDPQRDVLAQALGPGFMPRPTPGELESSGEQARGCGEGEAHKALKMLVAASPSRIGLPADARATVEHLFLSGDRVDVKFDLPDGTGAVVEVETICPLPGAHQAVKYRALLEVERRDGLGSGRVEAILVAHGFDDETRDLARRYGVRLVEMRP